MTNTLQKCVAEFAGTFMLVFAGTGAIVVNDVSGGTITHVGIGLTFGLVVMAGIYAVGDVSGAHFNPAVSIGFWLAKRMKAKDMAIFIATQCVAAIAASALMRFLFMDHETLGATMPANSAMQSFVLEVVMTWFLMFVILSVSTGAKEKGIMAGAAIGAVVGLECLFGGPISNASMNPARSLGPALVSMQLADLWIYLLAPITGAALAVATSRAMRGE